MAIKEKAVEQKSAGAAQGKLVDMIRRTTDYADERQTAELEERRRAAAEELKVAVETMPKQHLEKAYNEMYEEAKRGHKETLYWVVKNCLTSAPDWAEPVRDAIMTELREEGFEAEAVDAYKVSDNSFDYDQFQYNYKSKGIRIRW